MTVLWSCINRYWQQDIKIRNQFIFYHLLYIVACFCLLTAPPTSSYNIKQKMRSGNLSANLRKRLIKTFLAGMCFNTILGLFTNINQYFYMDKRDELMWRRLWSTGCPKKNWTLNLVGHNSKNNYWNWQFKTAF